MDLNVTAAIVNHGTPDLTRMAVWSLRSLYPDLPLLVVESGSPDDSAARLRALMPQVQPARLIETPENIHHGPALDLAVREAETALVLTFDSDCIAYRSGFLEGMAAAFTSDADYMAGEVLLVDEMGYKPARPDTATFRYVHPKCALVRRSLYLDLPPFEKHGAPLLTNEKAAAGRGLGLLHFPVGEYVYHFGRGTAARYGYGLGMSGRLYELKHRLSKLLK